jgi:hypothetical protein
MDRVTRETATPQRRYLGDVTAIILPYIGAVYATAKGTRKLFLRIFFTRSLDAELKPGLAEERASPARISQTLATLQVNTGTGRDDGNDK